MAKLTATEQVLREILPVAEDNETEARQAAGQPFDGDPASWISPAC
jgi:hypothetical protein